MDRFNLGTYRRAISTTSAETQRWFDIGLSYRSAIFCRDAIQKAVAEDTIADVDASGLWPGKVATELAPAGRLFFG